MIRFALLVTLAAPALAAAPHTGVAGSRSMPEFSDLVLFAVAAFGVWFARRALRARFRRASKD
ncbi:MAG: hypothetical protein WDN24_09645 [Sphingomonas sp.]